MKPNGQRLTFAIISCIGWFPIALYSVFIKNVNIELRYFSLFYKFSGLDGQPVLSDRLFIYTNDLLFSFLFIPLLIIGLVYFFPRKKTIFFISLFSVITLVLLFANMHSWGTMGKPLSYSALIDAAVFALQSPKFITMYVDYGSWGKFTVLLLATLTGYLSARKISNIRYLNSLVASSVIALFAVSTVLAGIGLQSEMKKANVFRNFIMLSLVEFVDAKTDSNFKKISGDDVLQSFYTFTKTKRDQRSVYTAQAKGNDLIVIILETGPVKFIDLENDIESFPTINKLKKNSLIAYNHNATFPGSAQSLFSLFFSIYPPFNYYQSCISKQETFEKPFPGFVSKLVEVGYQANLYLPFSDVIPLDEILHNNIGFDKIYFGEEHNLQEDSYDLMAWEEMKKDVALHIDQNKPYVSVFMPQLGHAPWKGRPASVTVQEYGKKLAVLQDQWLSELVDLLEKKNKLDSTTIVITADHGIRTAKEDPDFNMGFIDEYSYHVPLVIYSQSAFPRTFIIRNQTSHLDISPSLINLFGLSDMDLMEQGVNLWDQHINDRDLYFLGNWGCNADGYYSNEHYFMYNEVLGLCFENSSLDFKFSDVVTDKEESTNIKNRIQQLYNIQEQLYSTYLCEEK